MRLKRQYVTATLLLTGLAVPSWIRPSTLCAQQEAYPAPKLLTRAPETGYVLGAGDQLNLHVVDLEEYTDKTVQVDPDGEVDLPLIGQVEASGHTIEEFKSEVSRRLAKYVNSPKVSVNLITNKSSKISVLGQVNTPGVRELVGPTTLVEALSESGGLKTDAGPRLVVTRAVSAGPLNLDGQRLDSTGMYETAEVPVDDVLLGRRPSSNIALKPGDVISVPKAAIVYVLGDVHRSGGFPIPAKSSMSVLQALALAEGLGPNSASRSAKILRPSTLGDGKSTEIPVNVSAIVAGKVADPLLFADDILYIPNSAAQAGAKRAAEIALQVATGVLIYR